MRYSHQHYHHEAITVTVTGGVITADNAPECALFDALLSRVPADLLIGHVLRLGRVTYRIDGYHALTDIFHGVREQQ